MGAVVVDMDSTPLSLDMNYMENCWGSLTMAVYEGNRQFDTLDDLKQCLLYEWENLDRTTLDI